MYRLLPWYKGFSAPKDNILSDKLCLTGRALFGDLDESFVEWFKDIRRLAWGETPKYDIMIRRFCNAWKSRGFLGEPGEVDWLEIWEDASEIKVCPGYDLGAKEDDIEKQVAIDITPTPMLLDDPKLAYAMTTAFDYCTMEDILGPLDGVERLP